MNVLAIDTATEILSVALRCVPDAPADGRRARSPSPTLYAATRDVGLKHSSILMPIVDQLLRDAGLRPADLDLVACTRGPGSFTGLRIGMATAKGLGSAVAAGRGLERAPVVSIPTLAVMAHPVALPGFAVLPVIDGRKNRFYSAVFREDLRLTEDLDLSADEIAARALAAASSQDGGRTSGRVIVTGPHAALFLSRLADPDPFALDPGHRRGHAETLAYMATAAFETSGPDASDQGPVYVRSSDAELGMTNSSPTSG